MTFLTILGVTEILCSFRLVLESKTGKELPELSRFEFLEKFSGKQFCFIRCRRLHLRAIEYRRYSRFTFVKNTIGNSPKVLRAKFLGSDRLFHFISICKFGRFKNPFATTTSLSELYFRFRRTFLLVQMKKVISINYGSCASSWKPWRWVRLDQILTIMDIHINSNLCSLTKFTSSSRSTEFEDTLKWNISQIITKIIPVSTRIVMSYAMKQGILLWIRLKVSGNGDNNTIRISQWKESHYRANTRIKRNKSIQKSRTVRITVWDPSRKVE